MSDSQKKVRHTSRVLIKHIWDAVESGRELHGKEKNIADILAAHPEYKDFWEKADTLTDKDTSTKNGINPFLHLYAHIAVEEQIEKNKPEQVTEIFKKLKDAGFSDHEALHKLGTAFMEELFEAARSKRNFDIKSYIDKLEKLI